MKLLTVEIENYRGITESGKIYIPDFLLLMGPNNSGKSTILKALDIFFNNEPFDPFKDYPRARFGKKGFRASTKFRLTFGREPGEKLGHQLSLYVVRRKILNKYQEVIIVEIEYPRDHKDDTDRKIKINKKYRGTAKHSDKYYKILQFVNDPILRTLFRQSICTVPQSVRAAS